MTERDSQSLIMVLVNDGGARICEMTLYVSAPIFNLSPAGNAGLIHDNLIHDIMMHDNIGNAGLIP
jgi:hypothetical protein